MDDGEVSVRNHENLRGTRIIVPIYKEDYFLITRAPSKRRTPVVQLIAKVPIIEAPIAINGFSILPWKTPLTTATPMRGETMTEAIARAVTRRGKSYRSEPQNQYMMLMAARQAPPQIAPPTAPAAIDDDIGTVRICALFGEAMMIIRCPSRVRQRFVREHAGTDKAMPAIAHSGDELMRSVRVTSDEMDGVSSVEGAVVRGVLLHPDSISDSDISLGWVIPGMV